MAESTLATTPKSRRTSAGRAGKDRREGIIELPSLVHSRLYAVARAAGQEALVVLIVDYYLRPKDLVRATLAAEGLVVPGFGSPLLVPDDDRELLDEWLGRRSRPRSAAAVYNVLRRLRDDLVGDLANLEESGGPRSPWRDDLRLGVGELRRLARERFVGVGRGDEAVYQELCHDQRARAGEQRLRLCATTREALAAALAEQAERLRALIPEASRAALERIG